MTKKSRQGRYTESHVSH